VTEKERRPWLPTVILLGVAALVIAFSIWIVPLLGEPPELGAQPTLALLWEFTSADLVKISVTKGFQMTVVERDPTGMAWRVAMPAPGDADIIRVYNLVDQVAGMRSRFLENVAPVNFGLVEPQAQVTLGLADGRTVNFSIGDENPSRTDYYIQKEGDSRVYIVPAGPIAGLLDMVDNPPYPATPAPPPSPIETPEASPGVTPTVSITGTVAPEASPTVTPTTSAETKTPTATRTPTPEASATETPTPVSATETPTKTPAPTPKP
jgi:hypothetical protein